MPVLYAGAVIHVRPTQALYCRVGLREVYDMYKEEGGPLSEKPIIIR